MKFIAVEEAFHGHERRITKVLPVLAVSTRFSLRVAELVPFDAAVTEAGKGVIVTFESH